MVLRLVPGVYERLVTEELEQSLAELARLHLEPHLDGVDPAEVPSTLARYVHDLLLAAFPSLPAKDRAEHQVRLANELLDLLRQRLGGRGVTSGDTVKPGPRKLVAISPSPTGLGAAGPLTRPSLPLAQSALLVNAPRDPSLGAEVIRELASVDRVDLIVSFLRWQGFRVVRDALRSFLERRPGMLRVLTTVYMGATERRVLDALVDMGAQVKVSFDTRRTRLHAKAWLFHRDSGYSTGIIGSSNLSAAALLDGVEWNVRLSRVDNSHILERFQAVFDEYWTAGEFEPYDPVRDGKRFDEAVRRERRGDQAPAMAGLDIRPYAFQQEILDRLMVERDAGRRRCLVVAATGTGKTVMAALDYRSLRKSHGRDLSLLFVAHRREILEQAVATFREALRDSQFGELLVAGQQPSEGRHVFASIQSLHEARLEAVAPDAFEVLIVDEFHHAEAPTYRRLLEHLSPRYLTGLTATPERADQQDVFRHFDGHVTELRLWDALDRGLLCPFQYFGISDDTDLSVVGWQRGRYADSELDNLFTGNHARAQKILRAVCDKVTDPHQMRALGFCVSIRHAHFMAEQFAKAGFPATAVTADVGEVERADALRQLASGEIRAVFSVDVFNEGVDVPDVDTVLFLRPTESATVFLQQLGRGLRLAEGKSCLTVLDFIGNAHRRFRFDARFKTLLGGTRKSVERAVGQGFPFLPAGCAIVLEREAKDRVLANVRQALRLGRSALAEDLRTLGSEATLEQFLTETGAGLDEVFAGPKRGWTELRQRAFGTPDVGKAQQELLDAVPRMAHINDLTRIGTWLGLLGVSGSCEPPDLASRQGRLELMLASLLGPPQLGVSDSQKTWALLRQPGAAQDEVRQLLEALRTRLDRSTPDPGLEPTIPLRLHGDYALSEVMAAFAITKRGQLYRVREGVYFDRPSSSDLLFVTLDKAERDYSPTTMYRDYPISPTRFHWQTQSFTTEASATGQRYIHHAARGSQVLLFVREQAHDSRGMTAPYTFLGRARYVSHEGERPMSIVWELEHPMPPRLWSETRSAAG